MIAVRQVDMLGDGKTIRRHSGKDCAHQNAANRRNTRICAKSASADPQSSLTARGVKPVPI